MAVKMIDVKYDDDQIVFFLLGDTEICKGRVDHIHIDYCHSNCPDSNCSPSSRQCPVIIYVIEPIHPKIEEAIERHGHPKSFVQRAEHELASTIGKLILNLKKKYEEAYGENVA